MWVESEETFFLFYTRDKMESLDFTAFSVLGLDKCCMADHEGVFIETNWKIIISHQYITASNSTTFIPQNKTGYQV